MSYFTPDIIAREQLFGASALQPEIAELIQSIIIKTVNKLVSASLTDKQITLYLTDKTLVLERIT